MFSIQKLLGKEDQFFALLEASAAEARDATRALHRVLQDKNPGPALEAFATAHRKEKRTALAIGELVLKTLVASMDREDVVAMAGALAGIPRMVDRFAERYALAAPLLAGFDFNRQMEYAITATEQVVVMVSELRKGVHIERIKEENIRLQKVEGDADKLMLKLLQELYNGNHNPLKVLAVKDLYEALEKLVDRCRDAGNVVNHIVLKHT